MYISTDEIAKLVKNCLDRVPTEPTEQTLSLYYGVMRSFLVTLNDMLQKEKSND